MLEFPNVRQSLSLVALLLAACASDTGPSNREPLTENTGVVPSSSSSEFPSPGVVAPSTASPVQPGVSDTPVAPTDSPQPTPSDVAPADQTTVAPTATSPNASVLDPGPGPSIPPPSPEGAGGSTDVGPSPAGAGGASGSGAIEPGAGGATGMSPDGSCAVPTEYTNLFATLLDKTQEETDAKVEAAFEQLFHGGSNDTVYYESGDEGYILDVNSDDIRSEGQSYGMMIALQLDKKDEFDKIWRWSKRVMQQPSGLFGWHATRSGQLISSGSAPDGEEYFATALAFASKRWGEDTGIEYMAEARRVLAAMYDEQLFDHEQQLVKFVAQANYTDPSYILPAFYEVWACVDDDAQRVEFWKAAADTGRAFFPKTVNAGTGLAPYLANYDGSPRADFNSDSYRVVGNIMMDHNLFGVDPWQTTFAEAYAAFFEVNQQSGRPGAEFRLDGTATVSYGQPEAALAAQNAMVAFGVPPETGRYFVEYLWDMSIPSGQYRYYAGMLYMLALLHVSGHFQLF